MIEFTVYREDSGAIVRTGMCQKRMLDLQVDLPGEAVIQGGANVRSTTHYVELSTLEIQERPVMPITGGAPVAAGEPWRIDGIPEGTACVYPGGDLVVDDGFIEVAFAEPGEYQFTLKKFPYQDVKLHAEVSIF